MKKVAKPWGYELIFAEGPGYVGKIMVVRKGQKLSLQYHNVKDETIYLRRGKLKLRIQDGVGESREVLLKVGGRLRIRPRVKHQMEAMEECEVLEVSTPELNDLVRLEDPYGRPINPHFAVIMAGGEGTRLWPLSRRQRPKYLLDLSGRGSLVKATVSRARRLFPVHQIFLVTQGEQLEGLMAEVPEIPRENFIVEPVGKNTAPCAGLAALRLREISPDAVMALLPADHHVEPGERFLRLLKDAMDIAQDQDNLVVVGVRPTGPETGFGYIRLKEKLALAGRRQVYQVDKFVEKPSRRTAERFIRSSDYLWNTGILVTRVDVLLRTIKLHLPFVHRALMKIASANGSLTERSIVDQVYSKIKGISLDYGILEKARNVVAIPGDFRWTDVGNFTALGSLLGAKNGHFPAPRPLSLGARGCFVYTPGKFVAMVGTDNLIVVDAGDCLLICRKERCQDVKKLVERLKRKGLLDYL